ncbi:hypothetical protein [Streptomyces xantholiticus]|nr:hypothetical protein [Streptomyces xantholiticus]
MAIDRQATTGRRSLMVPDIQPGALEFADALGRARFKVEVTPSR